MSTIGSYQRLSTSIALLDSHQPTLPLVPISSTGEHHAHLLHSRAGTPVEKVIMLRAIDHSPSVVVSVAYLHGGRLYNAFMCAFACEVARGRLSARAPLRWVVKARR